MKQIVSLMVSLFFVVGMALVGEAPGERQR